MRKHGSLRGSLHTRVVTVNGFPDDDQCGIGRERRPDPLSNHRVIIDDEDASLSHRHLLCIALDTLMKSAKREQGTPRAASAVVRRLTSVRQTRV